MIFSLCALLAKPQIREKLGSHLLQANQDKYYCPLFTLLHTQRFPADNYTEFIFRNLTVPNAIAI
ncbi:MAG: hypothetical protein AAGG02_08735 [Cyanobacteria bacterium P01_H01_bin.15]